MMVLENDKVMKRSKEEKFRGVKKSIVEEVFGGYYLNTVMCLECMRVSRTRDLTLDVSVTITFSRESALKEAQLRKMVQGRTPLR